MKILIYLRARILGIIFLFMFMYVLSLMVLMTVSVVYLDIEPSISDKQELQSVFREEVQALGLEDLNINLCLVDDTGSTSPAYSKKEGNNNYKVVLQNPRGLKKIVIKHELYHIADGHCDSSFLELQQLLADWQNKNTPWIIKLLKTAKTVVVCKFKYYFWQEPQANLYAVFGWKL